jgi:hypothetical protein
MRLQVDSQGRIQRFSAKPNNRLTECSTQCSLKVWRLNVLMDQLVHRGSLQLLSSSRLAGGLKTDWVEYVGQIMLGLAPLRGR